MHYVDVGTSGGVAGRERGYCLMIGGEAEIVQRLEPIFSTLAPGAAHPATPGRTEGSSTAEQGFLHCGPIGAGHFVKMVHNGIEYGLMAAYAEGLNILRHADAGKHARDAIDAETSPLRVPELYQYDLNLPDIAEVWRRGSVIGSWLLDLIAARWRTTRELENYAGRVSDRVKDAGRWRRRRRGRAGAGVERRALSGGSTRAAKRFANRVLSAMRHDFGGHAGKTACASVQPAGLIAPTLLEPACYSRSSWQPHMQATKGPRETAPHRRLFLVDCDNTLLDNDRVQSDLRAIRRASSAPTTGAGIGRFSSNCAASSATRTILAHCSVTALEHPRDIHASC